MSVKGQLHACRDVLMVAMKKAEKFEKTPAVKLLRACLDLVEHMEHAGEKAGLAELEMTVTVLTQASKEIDDKSHIAPALIAAIKNAIGRLESLRSEIGA